MDCLFCNIIKGKIPCEKIYEDENVLAFLDIHPVAPVHVLVIPKIHFVNCNEITDENLVVMPEIFKAIKEVAEICHIEQSGYRIICNNGSDADQVIDHIHFHVLGGKSLGSKLVKEC